MRASREKIKHFVRHELGCRCADEVFQHIQVSGRPATFASANALYWIGGRLLVAVYVTDDWREFGSRLGRLVADGVGYRDQHRYNRLRLVIATTDNAAVDHLRAAFKALPVIDDRVHLHAVTPDRLPFDAVG